MTSDLLSQFEQQMALAFAGGTLPQKLAVAVSGGSDSLALCLLARDWCTANSVGLVALTIDHGLRDGSADEAQNVHDWLTDLQIEHHILKWTGPYPAAGIQNAARNARYDLLLAKCRKHDIEILLLGHQLEDQLETLLMRLSKGSGLQGLTAMRLLSTRERTLLIRPLLHMERQLLRDYLSRRGQKWIEDPSNNNPAFTRTKMGAVLQSMTALPESTLSSLALAAGRLQRADTALDEITGQFLASHAVISPFGFVFFQNDFYKLMPAEIAVRFLDRIFKFVRGSGARAVLSALENLYADICKLDHLTARTLSGCQIRRFKEGWIVCREPGRSGLPALTFEEENAMHWDDRFVVVDHGFEGGNSLETPVEVRKIGDDGWQILKKSNLPDTKIPLPGIVRKNLPAIWNSDKLIAVPLFSYETAPKAIAQRRFEMVFSPKCGLI